MVAQPALKGGADGAGGGHALIARMLAPDDDDHFVLKPMHSAFFATPLRLLADATGASLRNFDDVLHPRTTPAARVRLA